MKKPNLIITKWNKEIRKQLQRSGIYAIYLNTNCLYVGASQMLANRVYQTFHPYWGGNRLLWRVLSHTIQQNNSSDKLYAKVFFYPLDKLVKMEQHYRKKLRSRLNIANRPYRDNWKAWKELIV